MSEYKLNSSTIYFSIPFYWKTNACLQSESLWKKSDAKPEQNVFFAHVEKLFHAPNAQSYQYEIYELKTTQDTPSNAIKAWYRFVGLTHTATLKDGSAYTITFPKNSVFSTPKLIINQQIGVGILHFSLKTNCPTLTDICSLSYAIRKLDKQAIAISTTNQSLANLISASSDKVANALDSHNLIRSLFYLPALDTEHAETQFSWNMNQLIDFLLQDYQTDIQFFTPTRIRLLTYISSAETELTDDCCDDLERLSRGENHKYQLCTNDIKNRHFLQTFNNIYMGLSAECGFILTQETPKSKRFIQNFVSSTLEQRYLWIYYIALMQQYSLMNMTRLLTEFNGSTVNAKKLLADLRHLAMVWANANIASQFTNISTYTQHNEFYHYCLERLFISDAITDVKDKIDNLYMVIEQATNQEKERRDDILTILLAVMTIISGTCDALSVLSGNSIISENMLSFHIATTVIFLVSIVAICIIRHSSSKK